MRSAVLLVVVAIAATLLGSASGTQRTSVLEARAASTYVLSAEFKGTYHFEDHETFQGRKLDSVERSSETLSGR
jgi:hypothetical protein